MKLKAFLNGEFYNGKIKNENCLVVACDGGYEYCEKNGIKVDCVMGDFDSLGYIPSKAFVFPVEKDFTDCEAVVDYALKRGDITEIEFYNFGGKRDDHFLGNISVLALAYKKGFSVKAVTNYTEIYYTENEIKLTKVKNKTISLVPFCENANIIINEGLKYNAVGKELKVFSSLGISNVALKDEVYIKVNGKILIFVVK